MSDVPDEPKRKRGNPAWQKGSASPNPSGRPRTWESFNGLLRDRMSAADRVDMLVNVAMSSENEQLRYNALIEIINRLDGPVTKKIDATVTPGSRPMFDFSKLPLEARRQLLDQLRACRIEQPSEGGELDALPEFTADRNETH
jgi:hypothetical protein